MDEDERRGELSKWMREFIRDQEEGGELQVMVRQVLDKLEAIDRRLQAIERQLDI